MGSTMGPTTRNSWQKVNMGRASRSQRMGSNAGTTGLPALETITCKCAETLRSLMLQDVLHAKCLLRE